MFGARGVPSTYSGYETFLTALLPELARRGHSVTMYCRSGKGFSDSPYEGVVRRLIPAVQTKQAETLTHGLLAAVAAKRRGHDVVLVVNVANSLFCLGLRALGTRTVLNTDGQEWLRGKWGVLGRAYFKMSAKLSRWASPGLISDSRAMSKLYLKDFHAKSTVIPYCWTNILTDDWQSRLSQYGLRQNGYFIIAGRLVPENNADKIALAHSQSGVALPLVVLGAANYDSPVERTIRRRSTDGGLRFLGHIHDRADYAALVRGSMGYFHGHSVGGINPSLIEAMGCGGLIIALDTPFNREVIGEHGFFFDSFDSKLEELFCQVSNMRHGERLARGASGAEHVTLTYPLSQVADWYERLLTEVASTSALRTVSLVTPWS